MKHIKAIILTAVIALFASNVNAQEVVKIDTKAFMENVWNYEANSEYTYEGELPCIVDFSATWCGPCRRMEPILEELAKKYEGKIVIYQVDVDESPELAKQFNVRGIPHFMFFTSEGSNSEVGSRSIEDFEAVLIKHLNL